MKLTYWVAYNWDEKDYTQRAKTKKALVEKLEEYGNHYNFGPIHKVSIEYADGFDLLNSCLTEDAGWWEQKE